MYCWKFPQKNNVADYSGNDPKEQVILWVSDEAKKGTVPQKNS